MYLRRSGIRSSNPCVGFTCAVVCFGASVNLEVDVETKEAYNCMSRKWHQPSLKDSLNSRKAHKHFGLPLTLGSTANAVAAAGKGWVGKCMPVVLKCWTC